MKTAIKVIVILVLLAALGCTQQGTGIQTAQTTAGQTEVAAPRPQYTAYNIWRMRWYNMKCINYKYGYDILPAGTMVKNVGTGSDSQSGKPYITFQTVHDNRVYKIYFIKNWHPGKSRGDYKNFMITTRSFDELTQGMTDQEIQSIKRGTVVNGMSKKAVLVAYGYPPEHRTSSIYNNTWIYWSNERDTFRVCFDDNDRTVTCW